LQPQLLLGEPEHRAHIRYIFEWFMHKFYNEVTRYILSEKIFKILHGNDSPNSAAIRAAKKNILYHLDYISYLITDSTYLCGERITIADCIAAAQLSVLDLVGDVPWERNGKVKAWYALMKSRPSFKTILTDEMHGIKIPPHYTNPDF
jgi:glutathione S-transferase